MPRGSNAALPRWSSFSPWTTVHLWGWSPLDTCCSSNPPADGLVPCRNWAQQLLRAQLSDWGGNSCSTGRLQWQSLGRWKSSAFVAYIRASTNDLAAVAPIETSPGWSLAVGCHLHSSLWLVLSFLSHFVLLLCFVFLCCQHFPPMSRPIDLQTYTL